MNKLLHAVTGRQTASQQVAMPSFGAKPANDRVLRKSAYAQVNELVLNASIGIYQHERDVPQPISISAEVEIALPDYGQVCAVNDVYNYEHIVEHAKAIIAEGHINLLETFADRLAGKCMEDNKVLSMTVRVAKTQAMPETKSVEFKATYTR